MLDKTGQGQEVQEQHQNLQEEIVPRLITKR